MPLKIVLNDITKMECDAIVNAANKTLLGGGGVDGAIHRGAGIRLLQECMTLGGCKTGQAKITKGYNLKCKYIIHTVGPKWRGGIHNEKRLLAGCYRNSLALAKEYNCTSIAFPLISSGVYGYPKAGALKIAIDTISEFLSENDDDMEVYIVIFNKEDFKIDNKICTEVSDYINLNYESLIENTPVASMEEIHKNECIRNASINRKSLLFRPQKSSMPSYSSELELCRESNVPEPLESKPLLEKLTLEDMLNDIDESFSQMLLRKIDEKGITDSQCYKKANIDRRLFSKIRKDIHYKPSKPTVIAFAMALELDLDETKNMLMKAGYALSHSSKFDIIIEYFITQQMYDIIEINQVLFSFDQVLLGA